ncbi:MAG: lysine--tRNA ligase [Candidatus Taylorbacteria bacterium]|nr:lysine--tRNA ligase [Candidatus Taylorbacteria bacterium]
MSSLEEIRKVRLEKLKRLRTGGLEPYPLSSKRSMSCLEALLRFEELSKSGEVLTLAGRVTALRDQGGVFFVDIDDGEKDIQVMLRKSDLGEENFALWQEGADIGDQAEFAGKLALTKKGEKTLTALTWRMLAKGLRPLPEKRSGLKDPEERYRRRYLDLLSQKESKERFLTRSRIVSLLRGYLEKEGFVEVETSILQNVPGGASAEPFKTAHKALGIDLYLRIAPELDLKKTIIGGLPKVFEIGRSFRNEGIDVTHNPEFTTLEWYRAWSDAARERAAVEKLFKWLVRKLAPGAKIPYEKETIDFSRKFNVVSYQELLERYALLPNPFSAPAAEVELKARQLGVAAGAGEVPFKILENIFKRICRPKLVQPTFVVDWPAEMLPLAKRKEGGKMADAFQLIAGGLELVKAFSEQNDPLEQRERFDLEEKLRSGGDPEAQRSDEEFLEALEYGMPPTGGVGIGIDRLVMLMTNQHNIREVILFPTLRPKK